MLFFRFTFFFIVQGCRGARHLACDDWPEFNSWEVVILIRERHNPLTLHAEIGMNVSLSISERGAPAWLYVSYPLLRTSLRTPHLPTLPPLSTFKCGEIEPRQRYGAISPFHAVLECIWQKNPGLLNVFTCCVPIACFVFIN